MNKFEIRYNNWTKLKPVKFVFVTTLWSIVFAIPLVLLFVIFKVSDSAIGGPDFKGKGIIEIIFLGVIIAPIIETAIFQALPIYLIQRFIKWKTNILAVLISSFLFSLAHLEYSVWYSFMVIPLGVFLSQAYIVFQGRSESSFWMTCSIHACRNLLAITFSLGELLK
jgi:membrane protease YdiL (CAAX protease family)